MSFAPDRPISSLTVSDLELLISDTVRRVLREEIGQPSKHDKHVRLPEAFLSTFGAWEDDRTAEDLIAEVYATRTTCNGEADQ